jgi:hypothetical protein
LKVWVNAKMIYFGSIVVFEVKKLKTEVDYNGRCETPMGIAGRLRPRRSDSDEEAQLTPQGKGASWNCNQLTHSSPRSFGVYMIE